MKVTLLANQNNMSLQDVADKMSNDGNGSVSLSSLKATIGGKGNPTLNTMRRIAKAIGCSVSDILDDEDVSLPTDKPTFSCPKCGTPLNIEIKEQE